MNTQSSPPDSLLARLGRSSFSHPRRMVGIWLVALVGVLALAGTIGASYENAIEVPDSDTKTGFEILDEHFGGVGSGLTGSIVFRAPQGVDDPDVAAAMQAFFAEVAAIDSVTVDSPYAPGGERLISNQGEDAGNVAFAEISLGTDIEQIRASEIGAEIYEMRPELDGVQIEVGGAALGEFEPPESELIGISFAIVILIVAFGSVLAMGLPIGVAVAGVGIGAGLITLLSNVLTVPDFSITIGAMIGLGVGIDYALFIVTRYRDGLRAGAPPLTAAVNAIDTSGRAVLFAGGTVVISLLGMLIMGLAFITGMAIGAATTVLITMIASVTLLPAFLGLVGERIERTRMAGLIAAGLVAVALLGVGLAIQPLLVGAPLAALVLLASFAFAPLRRELPHRPPKPVRETWSYRWSRFVQRHPWSMALGVSALLLVASIPVLSLRLGFSDESNYPEDTTTLQAYELLTDGFGAGVNGPLLLVSELDSPDDLNSIATLATALSTTEGVAQVVGPIPSDPGAPAAAIVRVIPTTGPQDEATDALLDTVRDQVIPTAIDADGPEVLVTGTVAANADFSAYLAARIPLFFAAVLGLSFLLLMMVFRSLLVPLKAVIMNMLSIGAAYGLVVAVFQWGWGASLFGTQAGPIEPFIPMMLFAIVFGLSMDYEVFLLSRVKEEYDRTGDPVNSVADGLASTARVITAAAAIMVVVFGSFMLEDQRVIQLFGLGLASAVLVDATLVRMLLVPATMELLGARNWWLPEWLDRILPRLDVEGGHHGEFEPIDPVDDTPATEREPVPTG